MSKNTRLHIPLIVSFPASRLPVRKT